jgi:hypothetical protein
MQKSIQQTPATESLFFGEQNEQNLFNVISQDIQQKQGSGLTRQQSNRLGRTLEHYMQEVWDVNGPLPLNKLNREAISATTTDFLSYLRRNEVAPSLSISEKIVTDNANQPRAEIAQQRLLSQQAGTIPPRPTFEPSLLMDTGSRFEKLQQERIPPSQMRPPVPNFQMTLGTTVDEPSAISLYEQAKKIREQEAARVQQEAQRASGLSNSIGTAQTDVNPLVRFMSPPSIQNDPQNNPTLAQPIVTLAPTGRGPLQQDYIIKQDDIVNYKEIEYNLVIYSADRDWTSNVNENRYRFSVLFDPGVNGRKTFNPQPYSTKKFKNISRIELVKAILPSEGLNMLVQREDVSPTPIFDTNSKVNVLQYPYVLVYIPELDTNNYGTDDNIDNSFGILQYDANWYTDTSNLSDGYLGMIPKFMKCQKVYSPTPLATLTKLTIEFQTPDGRPLSNTQDTLIIDHVYFASAFPGGGPSYTGIYSVASTTLPYYYAIMTTTYFPKWLFQPGNRIQIKGINENIIGSGPSIATTTFKKYLEQDEGLLIAALGYEDTTLNTVIDGSNTMGYSNVIFVQAPMNDPTTGSTIPLALGGSVIASDTLRDALRATTFTTAKLINLTHQTNLVLRIITRELDPAARVRPDNL